MHGDGVVCSRQSAVRRIPDRRHTYGEDRLDEMTSATRITTTALALAIVVGIVTGIAYRAVAESTAAGTSRSTGNTSTISIRMPDKAQQITLE